MEVSCPALPKMESLPFATDRTEAWHMLLAAGKVAVSDAGVYFLNAADVVEQAATSPGLFSSQGAFDLGGSPFPMLPIAFDPPEHTRYRKTLDKFFGPRRMAERAPELRKQVGALIDGIKASGDTCEVMSALAIPFPSQVFLTLFGLPLAERDRLLQWKDALLEFSAADGLAGTPEAAARGLELVAYLTEQIAARRQDLSGDDLLTKLLTDTTEGALTDPEIIGLCFLFIAAGLDTVTSATGFALHELARNPELRAKLAADESAVPHFIEELLRVDSTIPFVPRVTTADVEVAGVTIPAGSECWLGLGSANHDPERYGDDDELHDARANHFAFGRGPHRCLGSHLARLELRLIIEEWNRRIPECSVLREPTLPWPCATLHFKELHLRIG
jgi:cytochrome P450